MCECVKSKKNLTFPTLLMLSLDLVSKARIFLAAGGGLYDWMISQSITNRGQFKYLTITERGGKKLLSALPYNSAACPNQDLFFIYPFYFTKF